MKIVAFTGPSNSGKTTIILKIIEVLKSIYTITVIKNDPSNKAVFDTPGKDSYKFTQSGASTIVVSPEKIAYFSSRQKNFDEIINMCDSDLVFVEGLKYLDLPRLGVFRDSFDNSYTPYIKCAIVSNVDKKELGSSLDVIDSDDINSVVAWVLNNAKEV